MFNSQHLRCCSLCFSYPLISKETGEFTVYKVTFQEKNEYGLTNLDCVQTVCTVFSCQGLYM